MPAAHPCLGGLRAIWSCPASTRVPTSVMPSLGQVLPWRPAWLIPAAPGSHHLVVGLGMARMTRRRQGGRMPPASPSDGTSCPSRRDPRHAVTRLSPISYWRLRTEQGGDGLVQALRTGSGPSRHRRGDGCLGSQSGPHIHHPVTPGGHRRYPTASAEGAYASPGVRSRSGCCRGFVIRRPCPSGPVWSRLALEPLLRSC